MSLFDLRKPVHFHSISLSKVVAAANNGDRAALLAGSLASQHGLNFVRPVDDEQALSWALAGTADLTETEKNDEASVDARHLCVIRYGILRTLGIGRLPGVREGAQFIESSKDWIFVAAEKRDHVYAQSFLGDMFRHGAGVRPDSSAAVYWYGQAAQKKEISARYGLAALRFGKGSRKDIEESERLLRECVEGGHLDAQITRAKLFRRQRKWNDERRMLGLAIRQGSHIAHFDMGDLLLEKDTGFYNPEKAFEHYTAAENIGHIQGIYNVARCHQLAIGVPETNFAEAYARYSGLFERTGGTLQTAIMDRRQYQRVLGSWKTVDREIVSVTDEQAEMGEARKRLEFSDHSLLMLTPGQYDKCKKRRTGWVQLPDNVPSRRSIHGVSAAVPPRTGAPAAPLPFYIGAPKTSAAISAYTTPLGVPFRRAPGRSPR